MRSMFTNSRGIVVNASILSFAAAALFAGSAHAATQGSTGATSTGTVVITASVPPRARISGLSDVAFLNQDVVTAASNAQDVCAWSNTATKGYTITASGSGAANAFTLANGLLTAPYSVQWNDSSGQTSGTALTATTAAAGLTSTATNQNCASGPSSSASLIVGMSTADLSTMQASTVYTGTLTLLMTPQ
ncbi:MAG: hypothetical protein KUG65_00730 [Sphingomonadaceae bacterium]|nr:hypothetical protein [Sphingomonadaceae bacterium]